MSINPNEKERILAVLEKVKDPEIGINIVKLKMIGSIEKEGGVLTIHIKLTVPGCPLSHTIEKDIKDLLKAEGYEKIDVEFGFMSREELDNVKKEIMANSQKMPSPIEKYEKKQIKNVIAVYSAKGGVGKSSVVSMLAVAAKQNGYKVGILDCDVSGPSIQSIFKLDVKASIGENNRILPFDYKGIKIISIDMLTDAGALIWRGPLVSSAIKQMYGETDWGDLDVLFLDLPPGTSDGPLTVFQSIPVDKILLVTTPQNLSQTVGKKTMLMADVLKIPIIGIIENMSYIKCDKCGEKIEIGKNSGKIKEIPLLAELPFKKEISVNIEDSMDEESMAALKGVLDSTVFTT